MKRNNIQNTRDWDEVQSLIQHKKAVLLYFMNDDCSPCLALRPKVENLLQKYPEMDLLYIDSRQSPEISAGFNVFSNPSLLLFFEGKETMRFSKYVSVDQLEQAISRPYRLIFG